MDYFKENYPDELRNFYLDEKYKSEILEFVKEKAKLRAKAKILNDKRQKTRQQITDVFNKDKKLQDYKTQIGLDLYAKTNQGVNDINKVEEYFMNRETTSDIQTTINLKAP
jgi:hypothetical protein